MKKKEEIQKLKNSMKKANISKEKQEIVITDFKETQEKEKTMKIAVKEGSAWGVMNGMGESYISPFALSLNANNFQISLLSSIPGLISPVSQIFGSKLIEKYSRRKIVTTSILFQALMWIPLLLLGLLFWKNIFANNLPIILIIFYSIYAILGAIGQPAWFSLMGDIVPEKIRGKYFSERSRIINIVILISTLTGAFILDYFKTKGFVLIGFSIIFFIACLGRLFSVSYLKKYYDPKIELKKGYYFNFWQFVKKSPYNNFGKFTIYSGLIYFGTLIAGPFFAVYMLRDLGFSDTTLGYTIFMLINISTIVYTFLFMPILGKFADKYGNKELLKIGGILLPLLPVMWLFSKNPWYLALVAQLVAGLAWAAFNLASGNFIYDSVTPQRRAICVTYYNIFIGVGTFLGATVGGLLAQYASITFMNKLLFIFLISGIVRAIVSVIMLPKIKEVRNVKKVKYYPGFYFRELNPMRGIRYGLGNNVNVLKRKLKFFK